jgi:hypothetical protein
VRAGLGFFSITLEDFNPLVVKEITFTEGAKQR